MAQEPFVEAARASKSKGRSRCESFDGIMAQEEAEKAHVSPIDNIRTFLQKNPNFIMTPHGVHWVPETSILSDALPESHERLSEYMMDDDGFSIPALLMGSPDIVEQLKKNPDLYIHLEVYAA